MKTSISSLDEFFKVLKKHHLLTFQGRYYMSDKHSRTVTENQVYKLASLEMLEKSNTGKWFEKSFRLKSEFRKFKTYMEAKKEAVRLLEKKQDEFKKTYSAQN